MNAILAIALAMVFGLIFTRIVKPFHLPNVTGYLVAGLLIGPILHLVDDTMTESLSIISTVALGFIAFSIGSEFNLANIKKLGKSIVVITFAQSLTAAALVGLSLWVVSSVTSLNIPVPVIFVLSAVATATAPAATLMVVKQFNAHGPVTNTLLPVVAFDDAIGLVIFSICFALAKTFATGEAITAYAICVGPLIEIGLSLGIGFVIGLVLSVCMRFFKSRANRLSLMVCATLLGVALCLFVQDEWGFSMSSLLTCMMIGAVFANMRSDSTQILDGCERWTPPLFMLFFVLSGAELKFNVIGNVTTLLIAVIYIITRSLGKYFGVVYSAAAVKADPNVRKYLGITLLPQAGVAIGMAQVALSTFKDFEGASEIGEMIMAIVLTATLVYELIGPVLTKIALTKAGEVEKVDRKPKSKEAQAL